MSLILTNETPPAHLCGSEETWWAMGGGVEGKDEAFGGFELGPMK